MKKLLIMIPLAFIGCMDREKEKVYDECQYVEFYKGATLIGIAHKGNCNNPIHTK